MSSKAITLEKEKVGSWRAFHCGGMPCMLTPRILCCASGELHPRICNRDGCLQSLQWLIGAHASIVSAPQWAGFIKDYDGGTLMECRIHPSLPYADFPGEFVLARSGISGSVASHTITLISQIDLVGAPAN